MPAHFLVPEFGDPPEFRRSPQAGVKYVKVKHSIPTIIN
jgi:hypothetical protein